MRLTDEENVNDSGIDMIASPPGKKLQNVLLLSGGEKGADRAGAADGDFQISAQPVLRAGRSGCAARRSQHRAADAAAGRDGGGYAVHRDHALEEDDGIGAGDVRGDDAGGRSFEAGFREVPPCRGACGLAAQ